VILSKFPLCRSAQFLVFSVLTMVCFSSGLVPSARAANLVAVSAQQTSDQPSNQGSLSRQLAKETREAAGEDDQAQFTHSASVKWVAGLTGLSLENAYRLCVGLNFVVIALAIFWASKKYLPAMFRDRTSSIQKAMEEARKTSEEANRRLAEIESRLSKLGVEIGQMRTAAEQEAAGEEQKIKAAAEEDARKIVQTAEQEIAAAAKAARRELTAYAADLAVSLAQKQIHVDAPTDQGLVRNFSQQLGASGGDSRKEQQ
jgi:F-type H+-transporting ATPase subunit b